MSAYNEVDEREESTPSGDKWFKIYNRGIPVDTIPAPSMEDVVKYLKNRGISFSKIVPIS